MAADQLQEFISKPARSLACYADFHFEDKLIRLPIETEYGEVIEATFCYGYQREKWLAALSTQVGCPSKCKFCELGENGLKRNLTSEEIVDQLRIALNRAYSRGYDIFDRPIKATFVMGGEPLTNPYFPEAIGRMKEESPLQLKISTILPSTQLAENTYREVLDNVKGYPNIIQFQISLNSTDEAYRQSLSAIPLASFKDVRKAGEMWFQNIPNPRKVDLTFTVNSDTPMDPYAIKDVLPTELFAIRLRDMLPTRRGLANGLKIAEKRHVEEIWKKFEDAGYQIIPGSPGGVERRFKLAPGETLNMYSCIRNQEAVA